jgi:hypothetical protein
MQTISEMTEQWSEAASKKGLKLPTKTEKETEEIFLSKIKMICEASGVKPVSTVNRNNGNAPNISEADTRDLKTEVERLKKSYGMSTAEVLLTLNHERAMPQHYAMAYATQKELREAWTPFSDILTPTEIDCLVRNRVNAPKKK